MQSQEQQLIESLFSRLKQAESQSGPRDAGAEQLINQHLQSQPGAPYYMAQAILIQEAAMKKAQRAGIGAGEPSGAGAAAGPAAKQRRLPVEPVWRRFTPGAAATAGMEQRTATATICRTASAAVCCTGARVPVSWVAHCKRLSAWPAVW